VGTWHGVPFRLTEGGGHASPRWSPFGAWLWLARADGSDARVLPAAAALDQASWSPTDDRLAYITTDGGLTIVDVGEQTAISLGTVRERVERVAWHPNGEWLACQVAVGNAGGQENSLPERRLLRILRADGQKAADLVVLDDPMEAAIQLAGWSGEGTHLLYWRGPASASIWADGVTLMSTHVDGSSTHALAVTMLPYNDWVVPEPATARLALIVGSGRESWRQKQLIVIDADGESPRSLTGTRQAAASPAWSPDGRSIAYAATSGTQPLADNGDTSQTLQGRSIWVATVDGQSRRELAQDPACRDERPLWSAGGGHLVFVRICDGQASLWLIDEKGENPRQVVEELDPVPDGAGHYGHVEWNRLFDYHTGLITIPELPVQLPTRTVFVQSNTSTDDAPQGVVCLWEGAVYVLNNRGERSIGHLPESTGHRLLAGRYLAYMDGARISVLDLINGARRSLHEFDDRPAQDYALRWSADGSTLVYARAWDSPDGARHVELGFTDGYEQRTIDTILARPPGPTPTPPSGPPVASAPGFANLHILGSDRKSGYLAVTPAGGSDRYAIVWLYNLNQRAQVKQVALPRPEEIATMAASPDLAWVAVAYMSDAGVLIELHPLLDGEAPSAEPSSSRVLTRLPEVHVAQLHWSPGSDAIAYLRLEGMPGLAASSALSVDVLHVDTGQIDSPPIRVSPEAWLHGWTVDGEAIVLEALDGISGQRTVSLVNVTTGEVTVFSVPNGATVLGYTGGWNWEDGQ